MSIQIKFRGKMIHNDEWIYGSLVYIGDSDWPQIVPEGTTFDNIERSMYSVHHKSVGQYAGKDSNGEELYQGLDGWLIAEQNKPTSAPETERGITLTLARDPRPLSSITDEECLKGAKELGIAGYDNEEIIYRFREALYSLPYWKNLFTYFKTINVEP